MSDSASRHHAHLILAILILLIAFMLRTVNLNSMPPGMSDDEGTNAIDAFHIGQTGNFPQYQDRGRPEPLYRMILAVGTQTLGTSAFALRFVSTAIGLLSIACAYWAASQYLHNQPGHVRRSAALLAMIAVAVAVGHLTISRAVYRAILQPGIMLLMLGFLARALRTHRPRDFILAGITMGLLAYTYTAALIVPAAFVPLTLVLLSWHRETWKKWLPGMFRMGIAAAITAGIPLVMILIDSGAVFGRASDVLSSSQQSQNFFESLISVLIQQGDGNPQYNAGYMPIVAPPFTAFFLAGIVIAILHLKNPVNAFLLAGLIICHIPPTLTPEPLHALRNNGLIAITTLLIAAAAALLARLLVLRLNAGWIALGGLLIAALAGSALQSWKLYDDYIRNADAWQRLRIHNIDLDHSEWFFRTDRRELADWIKAQPDPILMPRFEAEQITTRAWLLEAYPDVTPMLGDGLALPENTIILWPWDLGLGSIISQSRDYVLLMDDSIILLPPVSVQQQLALQSLIEDSLPLERQGTISELGQYHQLSNAISLEFEQALQTGNDLAIMGDGELRIVGLYGPQELESDATTVSATLSWESESLTGFEYWSFLQLQTQTYESLASVDLHMLRWLYPTSIWKPHRPVPITYSLPLNGSLGPGAYRLVSGAYPTNGERLSASGPIEHTLTYSATIAWIKVPQLNVPEHLSPDARNYEAVIADTFSLIEAEVNAVEGGLEIRLLWESLVERPILDATIFVHAINEQGDLVAQNDSRPWNGEYPTFIWSEGERVITTHVIQTKEVSGAVRGLNVGMYTLPDAERLPVTQNGRPAPGAAISITDLPGN